MIPLHRMLPAALLLVWGAAPAQAQPLSALDSFPLGSGASLLCSAQVSTRDGVLSDPFDRAYAVTCRDASAPVANLYVLPLRGGAPEERLAAARRERVDCAAPASAARVGELGNVSVLDCRLRAADVGYRVYLHRQGNRVYVAEGLTGYDSALQLALRSLVADRPVPGDLAIATTGAGDPVAFARAQAGTLDPRRALDEAYRRNNAGSFAEAAEFFASLNTIDDRPTRAEALANQALQSSNLGFPSQAEAQFAAASQMGGSSPLLRRRLRNYQALHLLNQREYAAALAELDRPVEEMESMAAGSEPIIDTMLADRLNAEAPGRAAVDAATSNLTLAERLQILDMQAEQLRGTILRLQGRLDEAEPLLNRAFAQLRVIRGGVIASTVWMRAQILTELAAIAEARQNMAEAERQYRAAVALLEVDYPGSAALLSAQARLATHLARAGQVEQASVLYRQIVAANLESGTGSLVIRRALEPYFALLTRDGAGPEATADLFLASQVVMRPGVAQTQAVLAREFSAGNDEGSRIFRQSVALTRDVERTRVEISRLQTMDQTAEVAGRVADLQAQLAQFQEAQVATQARLSSIPRYRAVGGEAISLSDLQAQLQPGEAYYKMVELGSSIYAIYATREAARAYRVPLSPTALAQRVETLRATISLQEEGELRTYPFDVETAHTLYQELFGPIAGDLAGVRHLVFEPDGAMLQLPPNLLVESEAEVAAYVRRAAAPRGNAFDFRGIRWMGRTREISTAVSARGFRDVRNIPPSQARNNYLGFGQNAPATEEIRSMGVRMSMDAGDDCSWSLNAWNRPISADELRLASRIFGMDAGVGADIVTGQDFTDTAITTRSDLDQYRVMHFATHGLVTPPRPECPARPSLLTSFGPDGSDGLLSFREIFDLRLDADLIILSACDTAGRADFTVTEETGLTTGGDFALDGLVRAFVGAGARMVIASHWPVPDAYDATERLIGGLFTAPAGTATAEALRMAQTQLMDREETSHPYYWAGFAVIGDGTNPVIRPAATQTASID